MNAVELLMSVDRGKIEALPEKTIELKRLSEMVGEPYNVTMRAIPARRAVEILSTGADRDGGVDYGKAFDANLLTVAAGLVEPDLKDRSLQKHFGAATPKDLAEKVFTGGEIAQMATIIMQLSGYGTETETEIKN